MSSKSSSIWLLVPGWPMCLILPSLLFGALLSVVPGLVHYDQGKELAEACGVG